MQVCDYFIMSPMQLCSKVFIYIPLTLHAGSPGGSDAKESAYNKGHQGSIPGLGRSPGEGNSHSLQYSGLENSMDSIVHGVTQSWDMTERLSLFTFSSMAGLRRSSKALPKTKLALKKGHSHCLVVCCPSDPLQLSESS